MIETGHQFAKPQQLKIGLVMPVKQGIAPSIKATGHADNNIVVRK